MASWGTPVKSKQRKPLKNDSIGRVRIHFLGARTKLFKWELWRFRAVTQFTAWRRLKQVIQVISQVMTYILMRCEGKKSIYFYIVHLGVGENSPKKIRMVGRRLFPFGMAQSGRCELLDSGSVPHIFHTSTLNRWNFEPYSLFEIVWGLERFQHCSQSLQKNNASFHFSLFEVDDVTST